MQMFENPPVFTSNLSVGIRYHLCLQSPIGGEVTNYCSDYNFLDEDQIQMPEIETFPLAAASNRCVLGGIVL